MEQVNSVNVFSQMPMICLDVLCPRIGTLQMTYPFDNPAVPDQISDATDLYNVNMILPFPF